MADQQANVTSLEAIDRFRNQLILYATKVRQAVGEVQSEVERARYWLESDRRRYWESEYKKRRRKYDDAKNELLSAKLSVMRKVKSTEENNVHKTKRAFGEAEKKLKMVKKWVLHFDTLTFPLLKGLSPMDHKAVSELPKAVALLEQLQKTLESYSEASRPQNTGSPPPPAADEPAKEEGDER